MGSVDVPSSLAFVIFTSEYYTDGKGFVLYYEGISLETTAEKIPAGERVNVAGKNGTVNPTEKFYSTYVFQDSSITPDPYKGFNLTVTDFNIGVGPTSPLDKLDIWGIQRESPGYKEKLLIHPIMT